MKAQQGRYRHEARSSPEARVLQDVPGEGHRLQGRPLVDAAVPLFPKRPRDKPNQCIETFTGGLGDRLPRPQPPDRDRLLTRGSQIRHAEEPKHTEPSFSTVNTTKEKVIQSLDLLCTGSAGVSVIQPMTSKC
jgi:hypothetical protein